MHYAPIILVSKAPPHSTLSGVQFGITSALSDSAHLLGIQFVDPSNAIALRDFNRSLRTLAPVGAILDPGLSGNDALIDVIEKGGVQYVCIAPDASEAASRVVCSNDRLAMCDATNFLISQGHRRIGYISISEAGPVTREREMGFLDALAQHGLDFGADLVVPADNTAQAAMEAALLLLAVSPRPTAILASSDMQAAGVLQAAHSRGIAVPGALSVMGFGDSDLAAALTPPLTNMQIPYAEMGFTAAIKLLDPSRAAMQPVEFFCKLVVRQSTAPLP